MTNPPSPIHGDPTAPLRIIPLGGLGEFGKNMMVYQYGDTIIIIDAGLMFPEDDMPGIDLVIPDISFLAENAEKIQAIILTHGHEDHIGALPYVLREVNAPVYSARLTLGLVRNKLKEHKLTQQVDLREIDANSLLEIGPFRVEFIHLCHSIPDALAVALHTPVGTILHASDFKFDPHPVDGRLTDEAKLRRLGERGVRVLLSDSTNAETPGFTPSEQALERTLDEIIGQARGRVILATFASNISRIQQVINVATRHGRKVGVTGRSMIQNTRMATELGYLTPPPGGLMTPDKMTHLPPDQVVVVCTGSQGEPTSALVRMSRGEYKHLKIGPGDTVIVSATPIPGNEKMIQRTLDNLFRLGANVFYDELFDVHVSGHGSRQDLKKLIELTQPEYFIPIHGEYRQLVLHARLAEEAGVPKDHIFVIEDGQCMAVTSEYVMAGDSVISGRVFVDGSGVGDIGAVVLRERRRLSRDGFLAVIIGLDEDSGEVILGPEILTRGFIYLEEADDFLDAAREVVWDVLDEFEETAQVVKYVKKRLADFCYKETRRRPMILPVVMEV
ncbi:MAG TPA: ribonuclease J [Anaerolineae bacterium]|nr:ribonuclease J [Anaerolineae bacterium]